MPCAVAIELSSDTVRAHSSASDVATPTDVIDVARLGTPFAQSAGAFAGAALSDANVLGVSVHACGRCGVCGNCGTYTV